MKILKNVPIEPGTVEVFKSTTTGKLYGCWKDKDFDNFIGMLTNSFDLSKPAYIITVVDDSGETWDFIGNSIKKEVAFTI